MRASTSILSALALAAGLAATGATAGELYFDHDRDIVHADSFGNLVIQSPAGYKRIVVGMGAAADGYNATGSYYEPEIVYLDEPPVEVAGRDDCNRQPVLLHGRSYMYGLPRNVVPVPAGICR